MAVLAKTLWGAGPPSAEWGGAIISSRWKNWGWTKSEGPGRSLSPPRPLLAVPNVTVHPSTASVPITGPVLLHLRNLLGRTPFLYFYAPTGYPRAAGALWFRFVCRAVPSSVRSVFRLVPNVLHGEARCTYVKSIPVPTWTRLQAGDSIPVQKLNSPQGGQVHYIYLLSFCSSDVVVTSL